MADADRTPSHFVKLLDEIERAPYEFDFFQAVRRLDCAHPEKPPTGRSSTADDDPIRFGQEASLAFAPATLHSVQRSSGGRSRLVQRFFGLLGPQGPLPLHLTEYVRDRLRNHGDHTLLRFLDVFHHRMISFFYRAWARVRPTVSFDRSSSDRFGDYVASLSGYGMRSLSEQDALPDLARRHFAGLLACQTRHLEGLLAILTGFFRLPVRLEEFIGQWIELPTSSRCLMGVSSARLGLDATVGSHVWDCQQKFRVIFGPLTLQQYYRMLPGGSQWSSNVTPREEPCITSREAATRRVRGIGIPGEARPSADISLERLIAVVRTYTGDELQWDLKLILHHYDTPPLGLGIVGRLGWSSWLLRDPIANDPEDLVLDATQLPENVEIIELRYLENWNEQTLGQTRDGEYIVATVDAEELDSVAT